MKLTPPMVKETMKSAMAPIHSVCPHSDPGTALRTALSGGYAVQPAAAAPPSTAKLARSTMQAGTTVQKDSMLSSGKAMSRAPICRGMMKLAMPLASASEMTKKIITVPCMVTSER